MFGETLYQGTDYFHPFPNVQDVFASRIDEHAEYLLPLASVDLSHLNPEWAGCIHFVAPIEPEDGVVGDETQEFHTYLCRDNWVGYRIVEGRYELACDFGFFRKGSLRSHYEKARAGFELRKTHFREHARLHNAWAESLADGQFDDDDRVALVRKLGGPSLSGNWSELENFPISRDRTYVDQNGEEWPCAHPKTEDGRTFEFIGCIPMYHYIAENPDYTSILGGDLLLFYDPKDNLALTTFDWS